MAQNLFPYLVVIFFSFSSVFSLLHPGLPPTHDGEYHIVRFYQFNKVLQDGQWYPRWQPDLNYGYGSPLLNYYYPLPNYVASLLHSFGVSFIDTFKLQMIIATVIGGIFFFLWTRIFWGSIGAVVASISYTYTPYYFVDVFIRGSVGEVWAIALFPAVLFFYTSLYRDKEKSKIYLGSISLALTVFSHNILAYMFFLFFISYLVFLSVIYKNKRTKDSIKSVLLGLGLSTIFWLPALWERSYVKGLHIFDIYPHFPEIYQLLFPSWGAGFSGADLENQMSFQIGILNLFGIFAGIFIIFIGIKENKKIREVLLFFVIEFFVTFFLMTKWSYIIWKSIPLLDYFQFPWRLLSLAMLISSFAIGAIFESSFLKGKKHISLVIAAGIILFAYFLTKDYKTPAYYLSRSDDYYLTKDNFIDGTNTPGNAFNTVWFNAPSIRQKDRILFKKNDGKVIASKITPIKYTFDLEIQNDAKAIINTAYFPGWKARVDGKKVDIRITKEGLMEIDLPKHTKKLFVNFENTKVRNIAGYISLISVFYIAYCLFKVYTKERRIL